MYQTKQNKHRNAIALFSSILIVILLIYPSVSTSNDVLLRYSELKDAGVLLVNRQGIALVSSHKKKPAIPASTTKLVTAWLALKNWGKDYHFKTHFYFDAVSKTLWIKGSGDPFLVSEELVIIAKQLKQLGITNIHTIGLDVSLFQSNLKVPGAGLSTNPYDALPTAIAANFNTISVKTVAGKVVSAEQQTPLTSIAKVLFKQVSSQKSTKELRINTGPNAKHAEQNFAQLLAAFLRQHGVTVGKQVIWGDVPKLAIYYTHVNSKNLSQMLRPMMKYSTNFIANQLVLILSTEASKKPANFIDVQNYMEATLGRHFKWTNFTLKEGAGLSRENQLSPEQLVQLLESFRSWKNLLPEISPGIYAKSGTLNNVSTLAGYVVDSKQQWQPFALMMNKSVRHRRRNKIAKEIFGR